MHKLIHHCLICTQKATSLKGHVKTYLSSQNGIFSAEFASCDRCQYAWMSNPPTEEELVEYYQSGSQLRVDTLTDNDRIHFKGQILFAVDGRTIGNNFCALEVGADTGQFLDFLRSKFAAIQIYYSELNESAQSVLNRKGFKDFNSQQDTKFDLIIMRHVLEHIPIPKVFLKHFAEHLRPNGKIFVEVPDFTLRMMHATDDFMFEHLHYFSLESLAQLGRSVGLKVEKVEITRTVGYRMTSNNVLRIIFKAEEKNEKLVSLDLQQLLDKSHAKIERLLKYLKDSEEGEVALFGAGWLTTELLAWPEVTRAVAYVIDSSSSKIGTHIGDYLVVSPDKLHDSKIKKIIIMSIAFQDEINLFLKSKGVAEEMVVFASNYLSE